MAMVGSDKDWSVRFGCIWALGQIGDKSALNTVRGFKFKESNPVTFFSWYGIEIVAVVRLRLDDPDASQWLGRVENGCSFPSYMAESRMAALRGDFRSLLEMLKLPEDTDRAYAADVLAYYGRREDVAALIEATRDATPGTLAYAAFALGMLGDGRAEPILRSLLDDPDRNVRAAAAEALECLGSNEDFTAHVKQ